jgi:adenine C2-methylase RlmN of 23S rRNA A2503 and tRNA A37
MKSLYCFNKHIKWLPCFNSILPRKTLLNESGFDVIDKIIDLKEDYFDGFLHFQLSINSTNEEQRKELFGGAEVISIEEIINYINKKNIHNRTVTLNFIVMKDIELDINKLVKFGLNKNKFSVKLIPLNNTERGIINNLKTFANYENYDDLISIGNKFKKAGIPVVVDSIAKCEEAGLCCGQLVQNLK